MDMDQQNLNRGKRMLPLGSDNRDPKRKRVYEKALNAGKENEDEGANNDSPAGESQLDAPPGSPVQRGRPKPTPRPIFLGPRASDVANGEEGRALTSSVGIASVLGF